MKPRSYAVLAGLLLTVAAPFASGVASAAAPAAPAAKSATVALARRHPAIHLIKHARVIPASHTNHAQVGDTVHYWFTVKNTGNTLLHKIKLNDSLTGMVHCPHTVLHAGHSMTCDGKSIKVTSTEVRAGAITNTATVTGDPLFGRPVSSTDSVVVRTGGKLPITGPSVSIAATGASMLMIGIGLVFGFRRRQTI